MKNARILFTLLAILFIQVISAQNNSDLFRYADLAFEAGNYDASVSLYSKIVENIDKNRSEVSKPYELRPFNKAIKAEKQDNRVGTSKDTSTTAAKQIRVDGRASIATQRSYALSRLAESYRLLNNYDKYEIVTRKMFLEKVPNAPYSYGKALMLQGKYKDAIGVLDDFMSKIAIGSEYFNKSRTLTQGCAFAIKENEKKRQETSLIKLNNTINSKNGAFSTAFSVNKGIYFSSSRPKSVTSTDEIINCNIYRAELDAEGYIRNAKKITETVNTLGNEAVGSLSADGNKLFFTMWSYDLDKPECAIYVSKQLNGIWLTPKKLGKDINVPGYRSMHPHVKSDASGNNTLFFSSNKPGTLGKMDIWICELDERDNPKGSVKNLGSDVNTPDDEVSPFLHIADEILYFSSEGRPGMGGLDVYKITSVGGGVIPPATNMGTPLNSNHDDAFYSVSEDRTIGFVSSNRESCADCENNYCYELYSFRALPIIVTIVGAVFNTETLEPIVNAMVSFIDVNDENEPVFVFTDEQGKYKATIEREVEYFATSQKKGFFKDAASLSTLGINATTELIQDFVFKLNIIPVGEVAITGIEYDYDGWYLRPESKLVLDTLSDFLKLNDNIIIEITSHTDERGKPEYNKKLSGKRANSVVRYLVKKGIQKERLQAKGMGVESPLIPNAQTEEDHQRNRRTAFRTLSQDYKPTDKYKYVPKNYKRVVNDK